ncbi:MAG: FkbM family methyltransferase [Gemmatimonadetes bacterium]|nr:FkbM family methyltransferase [Gemmatimonadota bacterium]
MSALAAGYDLLAAASRALPAFRGKGRLALALHRRLQREAVARAPLRDVRMRDGSRARWDLRDEAEALACWLGEADDAVRDALLARVRPDAIVLDVGANVGWWSVPLARRVGPKGGRVVAFEPVPDNRRRLEWALAANDAQAHCTVVPAALGDRPGELGMWLKSAETGAGSGTAALVTGEGESHLRVPVITLDAWGDEHPLPRCDLMKLDIEGAELLMLRGAERFVARHRPLIFGEFEAYWLTTFGATFLDVAEWAGRMDYRMLRWDPRGERFEPLAEAAVGVQDVLLEPRM